MRCIYGPCGGCYGPCFSIQSHFSRFRRRVGLGRGSHLCSSTSTFPPVRCGTFSSNSISRPTSSGKVRTKCVDLELGKQPHIDLVYICRAGVEGTFKITCLSFQGYHRLHTSVESPSWATTLRKLAATADRHTGESAPSLTPRLADAKWDFVCNEI